MDLIQSQPKLGLPETYTRELFQEKTEAVFQHIYEAYYGAGRGIYAAVM